MKTMDSQDRSLLESEILHGIVGRPDFWALFDLSDKDFRNIHTRKIFKFVRKLIENNQDVNLVAFANDFKLEEIKVFFDETFGPFVVAKIYMSACEKLREDTIRCEILKKIEECSDAYEMMEFVDTVRKLNTVGTLESFEEQIKAYEKDYMAIQNKEEGGMLLTTWQNLGKKAAMFPGDYVVLGARTSIGKTSLMLSYAIDAAMLGQKVLFFSAEMPRKHIFDKIAALLMQEPIWKYKFAKKPFVQVKVALEQLKNNFNFLYLPQLSVSTIRSALRQCGRIDLVVVDYLQLLKDHPRKNDTENLRLGRVSGNMKAMAGEFNTVFFVGAQLNRDTEKQKRSPVLSDLRDSGCIEQDADIVLLLHRENRESIVADLEIAKNRTGEVGKLQLLFNPEWSYFREGEVESQS